MLLVVAGAAALIVVVTVVSAIVQSSARVMASQVTRRVVVFAEDRQGPAVVSGEGLFSVGELTGGPNTLLRGVHIDGYRVWKAPGRALVVAEGRRVHVYEHDRGWTYFSYVWNPLSAAPLHGWEANPAAYVERFHIVSDGAAVGPVKLLAGGRFAVGSWECGQASSLRAKLGRARIHKDVGKGELLVVREGCTVSVIFYACGQWKHGRFALPPLWARLLPVCGWWRRRVKGQYRWPPTTD